MTRAMLAVVSAWACASCAGEPATLRLDMPAEHLDPVRVLGVDTLHVVVEDRAAGRRVEESFELAAEEIALPSVPYGPAVDVSVFLRASSTGVLVGVGRTRGVELGPRREVPVPVRRHLLYAGVYRDEDPVRVFDLAAAGETDPPATAPLFAELADVTSPKGVLVTNDGLHLVATGVSPEDPAAGVVVFFRTEDHEPVRVVRLPGLPVRMAALGEEPKVVVALQASATLWVASLEDEEPQPIDLSEGAAGASFDVDGLAATRDGRRVYACGFYFDGQGGGHEALFAVDRGGVGGTSVGAVEPFLGEYTDVGVAADDRRVLLVTRRCDGGACTGAVEILDAEALTSVATRPLPADVSAASRIAVHPHGRYAYVGLDEMPDGQGGSCCKGTVAVDLEGEGPPVFTMADEKVASGVLGPDGRLMLGLQGPGFDVPEIRRLDSPGQPGTTLDLEDYLHAITGLAIPFGDRL